MSTEEPNADDDGEDIQYFVRIGRTDLDGTKSVERALTDMNGIGRRDTRSRPPAVRCVYIRRVEK